MSGRDNIDVPQGESARATLLFVLKNAQKQDGFALLPGVVSSAKERLEPLKDVVAESERLHHHAWNVKWTFVKVSFCRLCHRTIAMQVAIPLGIIGIG